MSNVCGVGDGNFPQPGDPSTSLIIQAVPIFGGIYVTWDFPALNPHAVAHFVLYRGTTADPNLAVQHHISNAGSYFDPEEQLNVGVTYYYWVSVVSVNGTVGPLEGPASATVEPTVTAIIQSIQGKVAASALAQDLATEIARIGTLDLNLSQESQDRLTNDNLLGDSINDVVLGLAAVDTLVTDEINTRVSQNSALVTSVDAIAVKSNDNSAWIAQHSSTYADDQSAQASTFGSIRAAIGVFAPTYIQPTAPTGTIADDAIWIDDDNNDAAYYWDGAAWQPVTQSHYARITAALFSEQTARADADGALTVQINAAQSTADNNTAAINAEQTTRANADSALATDITTLNASVYDPSTGLAPTAAVATSAEALAQVNESGLITLNAKWSVKTDANGHVAGIGLLNTPSEDDGTNTSSFLVAADQFGIIHPSNLWKPNTAYSIGTYGRPSSSANGTGYIYEATVGGTSAGSEPVWGTTLGGSFTDGSITWTTRATGAAVPFVVEAGATYIDTAFIKNASIDGAQIKNLTVGNAHIIDGAIDNAKIGALAVDSAKIASQIQSDNYVNGSAGWAINKAGAAQFSDIYARGNIEATTIKADAANIVQTLHVAGNAITVPTGLTQYHGHNFNPGYAVWETQMSVYFEATGAPVMLLFSINLEAIQTLGATAYVRLVIDTTNVYDVPCFQDLFKAIVTGTTIYSGLAAGGHWLHLQLMNDRGNNVDPYAFIRHRSLSILEVKR